MDSELPYRSPTNFFPAPPVSSVDEQDYSTILNARNVIAEELDKLDSFHVFELLKGASTATVKQDLIRQIEGRQIAYEIIFPIFEMLNNVVILNKEKYKG